MAEFNESTDINQEDNDVKLYSKIITDIVDNQLLPGINSNYKRALNKKDPLLVTVLERYQAILSKECYCPPESKERKNNTFQAIKVANSKMISNTYKFIKAKFSTSACFSDIILIKKDNYEMRKFKFDDFCFAPGAASKYKALFIVITLDEIIRKDHEKTLESISPISSEIYDYLYKKSPSILEYIWKKLSCIVIDNVFYGNPSFSLSVNIKNVKEFRSIKVVYHEKTKILRQYFNIHSDIPDDDVEAVKNVMYKLRDKAHIMDKFFSNVKIIVRFNTKCFNATSISTGTFKLTFTIDELNMNKIMLKENDNSDDDFITSSDTPVVVKTNEEKLNEIFDKLNNVDRIDEINKEKKREKVRESTTNNNVDNELASPSTNYKAKEAISDESEDEYATLITPKVSKKKSAEKPTKKVKKKLVEVEATDSE